MPDQGIDHVFNIDVRAEDKMYISQFIFCTFLAHGVSFVIQRWPGWILFCFHFGQFQISVVDMSCFFFTKNRYTIVPTASCGSTSMATLAYLAQRAKRVSTLKKTLYHVLVEGDGGVFLAKTGAFFRGRSLRSKENKHIFSKILGAFPESFGAENDRDTRIWTKRLFKDALDALVKEYNLEMPKLPGFKYETWLDEQSQLLQSLAKKAKRNCGNSPGGSCSSLGSMDADPTLPYNLKDRTLVFHGIPPEYVVYA